jgi:hypothetical protein
MQQIRDMRLVGRANVAVVLGAALTCALFGGCSAVTEPGAAAWPGCAGFASQRAADRAWEDAGHPAVADGDGDGLVCETLPAKRPSASDGTTCKRVRRVVVVRLPARRYPLTADHVRDAIAAGEPRVLHVDRDGAERNRDESLDGIPTHSGFDRDEYPPAVSREGGAGAHVRHVPSADNRGAGSVLGNQLADYCDGQAFRIAPAGRGVSR